MSWTRDMAIANIGFAWIWLKARSVLADPSKYAPTLFRVLSERMRFNYWLYTTMSPKSFRVFGILLVWILLFLSQLIAPGVLLDCEVYAVHRPVTNIPGSDALKAVTPIALFMLHQSLYELGMSMVIMRTCGEVVMHCVHRSFLLPLWLIGAFGGAAVAAFTCVQPTGGPAAGNLAIVGFMVVCAWRCRPLFPCGFKRHLGLYWAGLFSLGLCGMSTFDACVLIAGLGCGCLIGLIFPWRRFSRLPISDTRGLRILEVTADLAFVVLTGVSLAVLWA